MRIGLVGAGRIGAFHARTLRDLPEVEAVVLADADASRAAAVARDLGIQRADDVDAMLGGDSDAESGTRGVDRADAVDGVDGVDGVVIAAATPAHAELIHRAIDAGVPVFCEKPLAADVDGTRKVLAHARTASVPLQVGFQRRFDAGYQEVRQAVRDGRLGWLHTVRAITADQAPPPAEYLPTSGGIFRDCGVHDYDMVRWVTGREVVDVYATGANRGDACFAEAGDVDTGVAVLRLDDDTLAVCTAARYNGAGYDVRLEACGSAGMLGAGLDDGVPLVSAEADVDWPKASAHMSFFERFRDAYVSELGAFANVVAGRTRVVCAGEEALRALLVAEAAEVSRRERRIVPMSEVDTGV